MLMWHYPFFINQCQLLYFIFSAVIKNDGSSWTIQGQYCVFLLKKFGSYQLIFMIRPNRKYAPNSKVSIDNWWPIQWVISYNVRILVILSTSFMYYFIKIRSLLACKTLCFFILSKMLFDNFITMNILMKLKISKFILCFQLNNRWMA